MARQDSTSADRADRCLDTMALNRLEQSFRQWADASPRQDVRLSRRRMLLIFLLIRYTGAKLNEVLALDPVTDIVGERSSVRFRGSGTGMERATRQVRISEALAAEIQKTLADPEFQSATESRFEIDPAFVRRKFYQRAEACGFEKHLGGPEMVRKARAWRSDGYTDLR